MGEIEWGFEYLTLFILILPFFIFLIILKRSIANKNNIAKTVFWTILSGLPLFIYIFNQAKTQNEKERWYVGTYSLEKFPNCTNCKLILSWDNTYVVTNSNVELEFGDWKYVERSVSTYVVLNHSDKLGIGKYQYNHFEPNYPE